MDDEVHPYFIAKAREIFANAKGDPDLSWNLAKWAQEVHPTRDSTRGVILTDEGAIVAEARYMDGTPWSPGGTYITASVVPEVIAREVGLAMGVLRRHTGRPVILVKYGHVCQGAGQFIKPV